MRAVFRGLARRLDAWPQGWPDGSVPMPTCRTAAWADGLRRAEANEKMQEYRVILLHFPFLHGAVPLVPSCKASHRTSVTTSSKCFLAQSIKAVTAGISDLPTSVSSYSTRGGTSG